MGYHEDYSALSRGMLLDFEASPQMFYHWYVAQDYKRPEVSGPAVSFGSAAHRVLLEGKPYSEVVAVYDSSCYNRSGYLNAKAAQVFRFAHPDCEYMHMRDFTRLEEVVDTVRESKWKDIIEAAVCEEEIYWDEEKTKLTCRCKPDFYVDTEEEIFCYDLKFSEKCDPPSWSRSAKNQKYWMQDVHYSDGLTWKLGKRVTFVFVVVETSPPYRIAEYQYDPISRDIARTARDQVLSQIRQRTIRGDWRDPWVAERNYLEVSPWEVNTAEVELGGFDDEG